MSPEAGGAAVRVPGSDPLRPGAFRVEGRMPAPGRYRWALLVDAPGVADRHDLGTTTVFADQAAATADAKTRSTDDPAAIAYLKEQQWTNEFATVPVREIELRGSIRIPAVIQPITGGDAIVSAPAAGRFAADTLVSERDVIDLMGLSPLLSRHTGQLSGGEKQRVAIARAFASHPKLVICDEITSSLDVSVQAAVIELLLELQRRHGTAYLFITHDLNLVRQIAHRIAVMYRGDLVELATIEELAAGPRHPYTRSLIDAVPAPVGAA
jgi:ABC-type dipeptide/oligopeptide/nickel transport system ATPase component